MIASATVDALKILKMYPVLAGIPDSLLKELISPKSIQDIPANSELFAESQPCQGFPLVIEGRIKVIKCSSHGRELMLYRVAPGDSCIISSSCLLGHTQYNARGVTEIPTKLLILPIALFTTLINTYPPFRDFVFHLFTERIANLMQLVEEVAFSRLDQRLAKLLVSSNEDTLHVTHQQLADNLGSVREIISRLLKGFASQGMVVLNREQLHILDRAALTQLATK